MALADKALIHGRAHTGSEPFNQQAEPNTCGQEDGSLLAADVTEVSLRLSFTIQLQLLSAGLVA